MILRYKECHQEDKGREAIEKCHEASVTSLATEACNKD
jgi:hypothetical protein